MSGLGMGHVTCGYDSEKEIFTRHINWRKKGEGGGGGLVHP